MLAFAAATLPSIDAIFFADAVCYCELFDDVVAAFRRRCRRRHFRYLSALRCCCYAYFAAFRCFAATPCRHAAMPPFHAADA